MENKLKINEKGERSGSIFSWFERWFDTETFFEKGIPASLMPKILFVTLLLIIYIANGHYSEKMIRKLSKLEVEVEDLRADYTTLKAHYMYARLQSEVSKKVADMGLIESSNPPNKIKIDKGEY